MTNDLLNVQEVADILKIARNTVYELIKRGELNCSKVGKQMRVSKSEVEAYLMRTMGGTQDRGQAPGEHTGTGSCAAGAGGYAEGQRAHRLRSGCFA